MFVVDGITMGSFMEVSGLQVEMDSNEAEIKEGGQNEYVHRLPGRLKWSNLVLKHGTIENNKLFEWFMECGGDGFTGKKERLGRRLAALAMVDGEGEIMRTWVFFDAFPVKWTGPRFASSSSEVASEQLEIAHHGFRVDI